MSKKHYAVIGHPIGHTMSPFIHKKLFDLAGIDADYTKLDIAPEALAAEYGSTLRGLDGYNITIPHKQQIIPLLDELDDKARMYGSIALEGRIMILGCGGVARTMAYEIALRGKPFEFAVHRRSVGRAGLLCLDITRKIPDAQVSFGLMDQIIGNVDVLINATPVGMYPNVDEQPIHNCAIGRCAAVYDAIYNPLETALVKRAKANGSKAEGGMSMLVWQAVAAHEIWDGSTYDKQDVDRLCLEAAEEMKRF